MVAKQSFLLEGIYFCEDLFDPVQPDQTQFLPIELHHQHASDEDAANSTFDEEENVELNDLVIIDSIVGLEESLDMVLQRAAAAVERTSTEPYSKNFDDDYSDDSSACERLRNRRRWNTRRGRRRHPTPTARNTPSARERSFRTTTNDASDEDDNDSVLTTNSLTNARKRGVRRLPRRHGQRSMLDNTSLHSQDASFLEAPLALSDYLTSDDEDDFF
mmetsp:Transcript_28566/g.53738  ORF Transcript_28566/g.53738 Transcript_28566/m.53738 type:complete len:217 (+) Transcript_28566:173-823(+)